MVWRYAEFIGFTQGTNYDRVTEFLPFHRPDPLYTLLRLRYALFPDDTGAHATEIKHPMEHVQLVSRYRPAGA